MKKLNGEQIFSIMSDIDPKLLSEAVPPSWVQNTGAIPRKPRRRPFAWLDSGRVAAGLSIVAAVAVVVAIAMAGQIGTNPPVGSQPATETDVPADGEPYRITYTSNGDGTCTATILPNDDMTVSYTIRVPDKSPDGDTVTAVENIFNVHMLLPAAITADCFETYIQAPMERYFGLTLEEAQSDAVLWDSTHPLHKAGFELRQYLAFYAYKPDGYLESAAVDHPEWDAEPIKGAVYLLEKTMKDDEKRALHDLLVKIGFTAADWEICNADLIRLSASKDLYPVDLFLSAGIETVTLPATLRSLPVRMFDEWIDLDKIVYEGTIDEWTTLTGGEWDCLVAVECADGVIRPEALPPDEEPLNATTVILTTDADSTYVLPGHLHYGTQLWGDPPSLVSGDMVYPSLEELEAQGVPIVNLTEGTVPAVRHKEQTGWTYALSVRIYDHDLGHVASGDITLLNTLSAEERFYYVELYIHAEGPYLEAVDGHEDYGACFTFRVQIE